MTSAWIASSPFIVGLVWACLSPLLSKQLGARFERLLEARVTEAVGKAKSESPVKTVHAKGEVEVVVPTPLEPPNLRIQYVEWLIDVPQLFPTVLLVANGAVIAVVAGKYVALVVTVCVIAAVIGLAATRIVFEAAPERYSDRRLPWPPLCWYTPAAAVAIIINVVGGIIVFVGARP